MPRCHKRSVGWTFALAIPLVNIVGNWIYAVTLERDPQPTVLVSAARIELGLAGRLVLGLTWSGRGWCPCPTCPAVTAFG